MKANVWTDVLQALVMYAGIFIGVIQGLILVGGFERAFSIAYQGHRIEFDKYDKVVLIYEKEVKRYRVSSNYFLF